MEAEGLDGASSNTTYRAVILSFSVSLLPSSLVPCDHSAVRLSAQWYCLPAYLAAGHPRGILKSFSMSLLSDLLLHTVPSTSYSGISSSFFFFSSFFSFFLFLFFPFPLLLLHPWQFSGLTPGCALRDQFWQCSADLMRVSGIEPRLAICK